MKEFDITILTDRRYLLEDTSNAYVTNVLTEDRLLKEAFERKRWKVTRRAWDDENFNWRSTKYAIFRTTWDYFDRFEEFRAWLDNANDQTILINSPETIYWNLDKKYLFELESKGIKIPDGKYIERGCGTSLNKLLNDYNWTNIILKPAVSGAARHTYYFNKTECDKYSGIYEQLIRKESMILQEFQEDVIRNGELSLIMFGGKFSHAVQKKAKNGDFRVQDDFGGTVALHLAQADEIAFAESVLKKCRTMPLYARIDIMRSNSNELCLGELELIEPELWFRLAPAAADHLATAIEPLFR